MRESHVIEQDGVFVGAAVRLDQRAHRRSAPEWRFVAVNGWLTDLDGSQWPSLEALRRATARGFAAQPEIRAQSEIRRGAHP